MKWLALLVMVILLLALPISVSATAVSITIYGTNASNAQSNVTTYGANNSVSVTAWNVDNGIKTFRVNSVNESGDDITFNISNITAYRVVELRVNSTAVQAYQATANGMVNFTYSASQGNKTYDVRPATNAGGYNQTWGWFWNITALSGRVFNIRVDNLTVINTTVMNATRGNFSGIGVYGVAEPFVNKSGGTMTGNLIMAPDLYVAATQYRSAVLNPMILDSTVGSTSWVVIDGSTRLLFPVQATTASAPAYAKGGIYYNTGLNQTLQGGNNSWQSFSMYTILNTSGNYTMGSNNLSGMLITAYADLGTLNVTLPAANQTANGIFYTVKKKDSSANSINVNVTNGGTIDGALYANITTRYNSLTLVSDGTEWNII